MPAAPASTLRRAVWTADGRLAVEEAPRRDPGAGEIEVAVANVGICGSDLHWYRGDFPTQGGRCPGHEIGGLVSRVGPGVVGLREGDRVGVEPVLRCGACDACRSGHYNHCPQMQVVGVDVDGAISEYLVTPAYTVFPTPALDAELTALVEPMTCGVHGFHKAGLRADETVLILGAGTIGLTAIVAARAAGAEVLITARHPHQAAAARRLGAMEVIPDGDAGKARLKDLAAGRAVDVVVETVGGHADTLLTALRVVRPEGRIVVLGVFTEARLPILPILLLTKEVQIVGANVYAAPAGRPEYAQAIEVVGGAVEALRTLVTHRFGLDAVNAAFETALDKATRSIKVQIQPGR